MGDSSAPEPAHHCLEMLVVCFGPGRIRGIEFLHDLYTWLTGTARVLSCLEMNQLWNRNTVLDWTLRACKMLIRTLHNIWIRAEGFVSLRLFSLTFLTWEKWCSALSVYSFPKTPLIIQYWVKTVKGNLISSHNVELPKLKPLNIRKVRMEMIR